MLGVGLSYRLKLIAVLVKRTQKNQSILAVTITTSRGELQANVSL